MEANAIDVAALDYARMVALKHENQALRDQIRDFQQLMQVKDTEYSLTYNLLQAKERENSQARARLQWLEVAVKQQNEAEAVRRASSIFTRNTLLRLNQAAHSLIVAERPDADFVLLTCIDRDEEVGGTERDAEKEAPDTPSRDSQKTPSGSRKAATSLVSEGSVPQSPAGSPSGAKAKIRRGDEKLVWRPKVKESDDHTAAKEATAASTPQASKSSPTKRSPPPALDQLEDDAKATASVSRTPGAAAATPSKTVDAPPAGTPISTPTPSKRLAIVDPSTGKSIDVTPVAETSRVKPTLISLEAISEGRSQLPMSPAGPSAPPLTLPPVVAGAPPISHATPPLRYAAAPSPSGNAGVPPPVGSPQLGPSIAGYSIGSSSWPPPPPSAAPSAGPPPCPPPSHPAPMVGDSSSSAAAAVAAKTVSVEAVSKSTEHAIAERCIADALGGGGGPVQMARGALAGGRAGSEQEVTAVSAGVILGSSPPPPPAGPAPMQPPIAAPSLVAPLTTSPPLPHWNAVVNPQAPPASSTGPAPSATSGLLGLAGYGGAAPSTAM